MTDRDTYLALGLVGLAAGILGARLALVETRVARIQTMVLVLLLPPISGTLCLMMFSTGVGPMAGILGFVLVWGSASLGVAIIAFAFAWAATWLACHLCKLFRDRR